MCDNFTTSTPQCKKTAVCFKVDVFTQDLQSLSVVRSDTTGRRPPGVLSQAGLRMQPHQSPNEGTEHNVARQSATIAFLTLQSTIDANHAV